MSDFSSFKSSVMNCVLNVYIIYSALTSVCLTLQDTHSGRFEEELYLKPLASGHVYAYFQFTNIWNITPTDEQLQHSDLFPRALGELVARYNVQELHISLTEGLWRYEYWGYPFLDAAPGAEVWAWFKQDTKDVAAAWKGLTGALSGLLCASLNFIDASNSLSPEYSLRPSGVLRNESLNSSFLRYATLPREIVCTENLTPWKKLLPCSLQKGLIQLLNAGYIHNTNYHSLGIHYRPVCQDPSCTRMSVELRQSLSLVYDMIIVDSSNNDWSVKRLFGIGITKGCPLATRSTIYVDGSLNDTVTYLLSPQPSEHKVSIRGGQKTLISIYDMNKFSVQPNSLWNIHASYGFTSRKFFVNIPPILYANRYIVGYGQERGGIVTKVYNRHHSSLDIVYLENIPWFLPVYFHTLKIVSNDKEIQPIAKKYIPGKQRVRPYYLEVVLRLPPRSVTKISISFDYVFLKWQEYPPDANHGFYIGSAIITAMLPVARNYTALPQDGSTITSCFNATRDGYLVQLRTESLIITLPTPDFSMPYNVICLACTVVALAFGPLHNITTKRLRLRDAESTSGLSFLSTYKKLWKRKETVNEESS